MKKYLLLAFIFSSLPVNSFAQRNNVNEFIVLGTWVIVQAFPSPVLYQDKNDSHSRLQFGLRWNISPLNYSFNANPMVSTLQFFKVNPIRRYGGSVEIFTQPEWLTSGTKFNDLKRFELSSGLRFFIPAIESGEYLSFSIGGKYKLRKNKNGISNNCFSAELGTYSFFGILGIQFNYNFESRSSYDIGLWLKYY